MTEHLIDASKYLVDIGPYFLGALAIAFIFAVVSIWWGRSPLMKIVALLALGLMVWFVFSASSKLNDKISYIVRRTNDQISFLLDNLLSRPKPITYQELQDMLPEEHPGHLVLYGEAKSGGGIYLLLRSPDSYAPRYYLMKADEQLQDQFKDAEFDAQNKKTQLFLGGKQKGRKGIKGGRGEDGHGTQRSEGGLGVFHPAPVTEEGPPKPQ